MRSPTVAIFATPGRAESMPCYRAEGLRGVGEGKNVMERIYRVQNKCHSLALDLN